MRRIHKHKYWCIEYIINGLVTEIGNEPTWAAIVLWAQKNLELLPTGEGKIVQKKFR